MSRIFVAGATGATGQVFVRDAGALDLVLHVRPKTATTHPLGADPRAAVLDLDDEAALDSAMKRCDAVLCLVGTMRKRFDAGDTYETSDVAPTRALVAAAKRLGVPRFVLMSAFGAGGAYYRAKAEQERIVRESGLAWTIVRPSALRSPADAPAGHHGTRDVPEFLVAMGAALARVPGLREVADDIRVIPIDVLCRALRAALSGGFDGRTLSGRHIWRIAAG